MQLKSYKLKTTNVTSSASVLLSGRANYRTNINKQIKLATGGNKRIKLNILIYLFGYFWFAVVSIALPIFSLRKCYIFFVVKSKTESMKPALTGTFTAKVVGVFSEAFVYSSLNIRFQLADSKWAKIHHKTLQTFPMFPLQSRCTPGLDT